MTSTIKFYRVNDEYGELSNFASFPIKLKGKHWPSSEHYFQAMKFRSPLDQKEILHARTPVEAARMGRDRKPKLRKDWESAKEGVMFEALMAKFTQHSHLKALLENTGDAKLVEHTSSDSYWGDGGDGSGKNRLGHLLMIVRAKI